MKYLMTSGTKPFGIRRPNSFTPTQRGIIIRYTEGNRLWQSEIGDQTGSSFESVEFKPSSKEDKIHANVWKVRFSCKVYFSGLAPKTLQNVEVYGPAFRK